MVDPVLSAAGTQFLNKVMADDPNGKFDDWALARSLAVYADQWPPEALYAFYAAAKQMGQSSAELANMPVEDLKARLTKALDAQATSAQAKIEIDKLKDTRILESLAQNVQLFLQNDYQLQATRGQTEIGIDATSRRQVAGAVGFLGYIGTLWKGICEACNMPIPQTALNWIRQAEVYDSKPIKSGSMTQRTVNVQELKNHQQQNYDELARKATQVLVNGQGYVKPLTTKAAQDVQGGAQTAIAAGAVSKGPAAPQPAAGGSGQTVSPSVAPKLDTKALGDSMGNPVSAPPAPDPRPTAPSPGVNISVSELRDNMASLDPFNTEVIHRDNNGPANDLPSSAELRIA